MSNLLTIKNVRGFIDENGTAQLNLEDVARGLGFTRIAESGNEVIRNERVKGYLADVGFIPTSGHDGNPEFIPENIFYRLAMKANNETAKKFQMLISDEILPQIRKTGTYSAKQPKVIDIDAKNKNADARLKNAQTRQAKFMLDHSERFKELLGKESMSLLVINAFEMITGENTLPRPKIATNKYYSATEIGELAGVSSNRVGKVAIANNMKTDEYGIMTLSQSKYSPKQIPSFIYNELGKDKLLELLAVN